MWLYPTNITYFRRYTPFGRRSYGRARALAAIPATISETIYLFCNFRKFQYLCTSNRKDHPSTSPDGGIGRRAGLKHQWSNPCRFDPGSGYLLNRKSLISRICDFSFGFCTTFAARNGAIRTGFFKSSVKPAILRMGRSFLRLRP